MIKLHPNRRVLRSVEDPSLARKIMDAGANIEWEQSDLELTPVLEKIAVRHGEIAEDGVILDYDVLYAYLQIDQVRESKDYLDNSPLIGAVDDGELSKFTAGTVKKIERELGEVLDAPVKPDVEQHWQRLTMQA